MDHVIDSAVTQSLTESPRNIKREDLFIASKIWNTHHKKSAVRQIVNETLVFMRQSYLDCMFIHWPFAFKV
jgi:diketogulonate reductase-like aldo/keto reductase